jgi:hypothetical protein
MILAPKGWGTLDPVALLFAAQMASVMGRLHLLDKISLADVPFSWNL